MSKSMVAEYLIFIYLTGTGFITEDCEPKFSVMKPQHRDIIQNYIKLIFKNNDEYQIALGKFEECI